MGPRAYLHAGVELRLLDDLVVRADDGPEHAASLHRVVADVHDAGLHGGGLLEQREHGGWLEPPVAIEVCDLSLIHI